MNTDDLMQEGAWSGLPPTESAIVAKSIDRPMPHNNEAERAVISCLFNKCEECADDVFGTLPGEECFVDLVNRQLFGVIREMVTEGVAVDAITVVDRIGKKGGDIDLAMSVCADYIVEHVTAANVQHYVDIVRDCYLRRKLIRLADSVQEKCYDGDQDVADLISNLVRESDTIGQESVTAEWVRLAAASQAAVTEMKGRLDADGHAGGLQCGFVDLDEKWNGMKPGQLIIVAARPSIGKTTLATNIALNVARNGNCVGIVCLEMDAKEMALRALLSEGQFSMPKPTSNGSVPVSFIQDLSVGYTRLHKYPVWLCDHPSMTVQQFRQIGATLVRKHQAKLLIADYLQLFRTTNHYANREREVAEMSREMKVMARELQVPVMVLCQLNRLAETSGRPRMSHLRESGAIEQDADIVCLLDRNRDTEVDLGTGVDTDVYTEKNRNGPTGKTTLLFFANQTRFQNKVRFDQDDINHARQG